MFQVIIVEWANVQQFNSGVHTGTAKPSMRAWMGVMFPGMKTILSFPNAPPPPTVTDVLPENPSQCHRLVAIITVVSPETAQLPNNKAIPVCLSVCTCAFKSLSIVY